MIMYVTWLLLASTCALQDEPAAYAGPQSFGPGVSIDWQARAVHVEAAVVLRAGPLELLVCAVNSREHESILATAAAPELIYQALGLVGAEPGAPPSWDPDHEVVIPARGWPLAIDLSYEYEGRSQRHGAHLWLRDAGRERPAPQLQWVFCGSSRLSRERLSASVDGTIVCVVDFDSALIGLPDSHSADNALLWVEPDTQRIPPLGTPVTLIISPLEPRLEHRIEVGRYGTIRYDGRSATTRQLAALLKDLPVTPEVRIDVVSDPWALDSDVRAVLDIVEQAGLGPALQAARMPAIASDVNFSEAWRLLLENRALLAEVVLDLGRSQAEPAGLAELTQGVRRTVEGLRRWLGQGRRPAEQAAPQPPDTQPMAPQTTDPQPDASARPPGGAE